MKNTLKFLGFIALTAAIGISLFSCNSGGGEDTYVGALYTVTEKVFNDVFGSGTAPTEDEFKILPGTKADLEPKAWDSYRKRSSLIEEGAGYTLKEIEDFYKYNSVLTSVQIDQIINKIRTDGYGIATLKYQGVIYIASGMRE